MYVDQRIKKTYPPIKCENCDGIMRGDFTDGDTRNTIYFCQKCPLAIETFLRKDVGSLGSKRICPYCQYTWKDQGDIVTECEQCKGKFK